MSVKFACEGAALIADNAIGAKGSRTNMDRVAGVDVTSLGSAFIARAALDPSHLLKRLGDGFYEQKLIREQVAEFTGYRYPTGFQNDTAP